MTAKAAGIDIREACADDLPGVLALYAQPEIDDGAVLPLDEAREIFERFERYPDYRLYVAIEGMRVVGSYALLIMDNLGHMGAVSAVVEDVVVDPTIQGQGIGSAMMRHAMGIARSKGCYKMTLSSNRKRVRAHAFYEGLGYKPHGNSYLIELHCEDAT